MVGDEVTYGGLVGTTLSGNVYSDPTTGQALMLTTSSDIACLYVYDGQSNPVGLLVDYNGAAFNYAYDPYGNQAFTAGGGNNATAQNPYAFHGGIQDRASGLVKFGIRWYNPTTGTWTQQDTLDAPLDPANANRYTYAGDDPVDGNDPTGRITAKCLIEGTTGIALAVGLTLGLVAELAAGPESGGASLVLAAAEGESFAAGYGLSAYFIVRGFACD